MNNWREFQRKTKKATLYWKIKQDGESYTTEHGQIGTVNPQTFSDTPGSKGKEDTKAYVNATANCAFHVEREIRKKQEHGYIEFVDGKPLKEEITELDFDKCLPKSFCSYKPQTNISESALNKIHKAGHAQYTRKYDGLMHLCVNHSWGWEIYSRRMDLTTERFPNHIKALENLDLDVGTIIVGEMVCHTNDGRDNFKDICRICRSDGPKARKLIEDKEVVEPTYRIFDMLYFNGNSLENDTFRDRREMWVEPLNEAQKKDPNMKTLIERVYKFDLAPDTWEEYAEKEGWEGFVVVDITSVPGNKFFSFDGDAKRPKGHHKLKPTREEDVVIYAAVKGSGKRLGTVGSVLVKQRHPDTGEWFRCGKVGSGFTDEDIKEIAQALEDEGLPLYDKEKEDKGELTNDGIVTMIEFGDRQPKTQKFRFPVFIRTRTDKTPEECTAQRLAPEEE
jgi:DNA ligase-1